MTLSATVARSPECIREFGNSPPDGEHSDTSLVRRYRRGSEEAAQQLYEKYRRRVDGYLRKSMSREVCKHEEASDLAQWIFADLFRTVREAAETHELDGRLWAIIGTIAHGVVCRRARYWAAKCRDSTREHRCSELSGIVDACDNCPEVVATINDLTQVLIGSFANSERRILVLLLSGHRANQVCQLLNVSERTVRGTRKSAERIMQRYLVESSL